MHRPLRPARASLLLLAAALALACGDDGSGDGGSSGDATQTSAPSTSGAPATADTSGGAATTGPGTSGGPSSTGAATTTAGDSTTAGGESSGAATGGEPGDWLLTVDNGTNPPRLVRADTAGGTVEVCELPATVAYTSLVFDRDGTLYAYNEAQNRLDTLDPCTCSFQLVGPTSTGPLALGLAPPGEARLLGLWPDLDALVQIDLGTGLATTVGPLGFLFEGSALAWSDTIAAPYAVEGANDYVYTIDVLTGEATPLQPLSVDVTDPGLAVHPGDDTPYVCSGDTLYSLDPATGTLLPIGPLGLTGACRTLAAPQTAVACADAL